MGLLRLVLVCLLTTLGSTLCYAQVDESPLEQVRVVKAFQQLRWPDWVTGEGTGKRRDPRPVIIMGAGDGSGRMFVASQYGAIYFFENRPDATEMHPFLNIHEKVMPFKPGENEEGFLGLAFHPRFAENGEFFVSYSCAPTPERPHQSRMSRFRVMQDDPTRADPQSEEVILEVGQPFWNHNGGTILFGPDGYLYVSFGDGGRYGDPHMNGQNLRSLHGKLLRIDVDSPQGDRPYGIPGDNPFVNAGALARPEIWAYGLRNLWRPTFDRVTNVLWAADVGQDAWEEINIIERGGNYGWNFREGRHPYGPGGFQETANLIEPIWEYDHSVGKSITGGYIYRGKKIPALQGAYLYADYVTGQVWALRYDFEKKRVTSNRSIRSSGSPVLTFGEDDEGEVYFTSERELFKFEAVQ